MNLSEMFSGVAYKVLVRVDLPDCGSNQHELNGSQVFAELFGRSGTIHGSINWRRFADDGDTQREIATFTWYDARARSTKRTGRSEWRFYYTGGFLEKAEIGDLLCIAKTKAGEVFGWVFQKESAWFRSAVRLFGFTDADIGQTTFEVVSKDLLQDKEVEFVRRAILEELEIDYQPPISSTNEDLVVSKFGEKFPGTRAMTEFAREQVEVDISNCDETLIQWIERETQLFFALEKRIVGKRLVQGFANIEDFIAVSLSVQNRRKSRMGYSLQHHLAALFRSHKLRFVQEAKTEGRNRPDFVFPSQEDYHDPQFPNSLLVMLAAKSTCKDRWRQILAEADKIPQKHLCTLETSISTAQTEQMASKRVTLVIPEPIKKTYLPAQQRSILSVGEFVEFVRSKQREKRRA